MKQTHTGKILLGKILLGKYYQENEEKKACKKYQNLSKEEKKKWQYGHEWYKNFSEDEKQKLAEYRKKYCWVRSITLLQL